jgi:hypothetical protein
MEKRRTIDSFFFKGALDAITNGSSVAPVFIRSGIKNLVQLLAAAPNLRTAPASPLFETAIASLQAIIIEHNPADGNGIVWPEGEKGIKYLRAIVTEAQNLEPANVEAAQDAMRAEMASTFGTTPAANSSEGVKPQEQNKAHESKSAKTLEVEGARFYNNAVKIFNDIPSLASDRVKYSVCAEMRGAWMESCPFAHPLAEFHLELKTLGSKGTTYSAFGQEWTTKEASEKAVEIKDLPTLRRQMLRRKDGPA